MFFRLAVSSSQSLIAIPHDNRHIRIYDINGNRIGRLPRSNRQVISYQAQLSHALKFKYLNYKNLNLKLSISCAQPKQFFPYIFHFVISFLLFKPQVLLFFQRSELFVKKSHSVIFFFLNTFHLFFMSTFSRKLKQFLQDKCY